MSVSDDKKSGFEMSVVGSDNTDSIDTAPEVDNHRDEEVTLLEENGGTPSRYGKLCKSSSNV